MKKRALSLIVMICMIMTIVPPFTMSASAQSIGSGAWSGTETTGNLIPAMTAGQSLTAVGWGNIGDQIQPNAYKTNDEHFNNRVGIQARNDSHDIGNKEYSGGVYWPVDFSASERMKIQKGDLYLNAAARYWYQASAEHSVSLRLEFYDAANNLIDGSHRATNRNYWVAHHDQYLSLSNILIPVNTAHLKIWYSNWGSLAGRPFIGDFSLTLTDKKSAGYIRTTAVSEQRTYHIGEKIRFRVEMDEPVKVVSGGYVVTNLGNAEYIGQHLGDSSDIGQYIYYELTVAEDMLDSGNKIEVKPQGVRDVMVADDAGHATGIGTDSGCSANGIYADNKLPSLVSAHLYMVNSSTNIPAYMMPDDMVTYALTFDEELASYDAPLMHFYVDDKYFLALSENESASSDGKTLYLTTKLVNCRSNGQLRLSGIESLSLTDSNGNKSSYTNKNISCAGAAYKSVFTVSENLENLNLSGPAAAYYGSAWSGSLSTGTGYNLPDKITVSVNNNVITGGYTYNPTTGDLKIDGNTVKGDILIGAAAQPKTYTIMFDMQGGGGGTDRIGAAYQLLIPAITAPVKDGYTFGGYFTEKNGGGEQYYSYDGKSDKKYSLTSGVMLYAKWSPNSYTLTLDAAGGTGSGTVSAVYEQDMPEITLPSRAGYSFDGYYTQQDGGGVKYYNSDGSSARVYDKINGLTLYAKWNANTYTVAFDKRNGTGGTDKTDAVFDLRLPSIEPPVRTGYTFAGYYENENGMGTQYYYADGTSAMNMDIADNCTLYAKWTANTYDAVLNAQGGSGSATVTATYDDAMPAIAAPDKPGYLFKGYFSEPNGGGERFYNEDCSSAKAYDRAEPITLYAQWTPIKYNIQLYSRGENVGALNDVTYGELRLPSAESIGISYANHNFMGWNVYDEQNWAMYTPERTYQTGLVTEQGKTAYVYASWLEKDKYTVTYDANGGEGIPPSVELHVDEIMSISSLIPKRENYTFAGWSDKSDAAEAKYQPGDRFTMGASLVTLFAVWAKNPELSYNANGGVFSMHTAAVYPAAGTEVKLTASVPQKDGYEFIGWAETENAAENEIVTSPYIMPDKDTVLYAVYKPVKYKLNVYAADGYRVDGIADEGYCKGEYAEFTVSGENARVYIDGVQLSAIDGKYRFEVNNSASVIVSDNSGVYVIYNAGGGVNVPVDMTNYADKSDAKVTSAVPSKTGYVFDGWSLGDVIYRGGETIAVAGQSLTLTAVWTPAEYTVKYDANGGSGNMDGTTAVYDKEFTLSENSFSKEGCQFAGWSYSADGEIAYVNNAKVKNLAQQQNSELILYAVWTGAKTTVKFNFELGSGGSNAYEVSYGELLTSSGLVAPTRYGYIFNGYYTAKDGGGEQVYNADMSLAGDYKTNTWNSVLREFDLYAAWTPISYKVAFVNGTELLSESVAALYGQSFKLPAAKDMGITVADGCSFKGWSIASGSNAVYYNDGQTITTGLSAEDGSVIYLYSVITENESYKVRVPGSAEGYKVSYNGEELSDEKLVKLNRDEDIVFSVSIEDGYSADKMAVSANGIMLGAVQVSGSTYTYTVKNVSADTDIKIYNVKKEKFSIILNDGTGYSVAPKNTMLESGEDFTFTVTLRDGYENAEPVVYANGGTLNGTKNGNVYTYNVANVTEQPVISVSVIPKPQHTVSFINNGAIFAISSVEENMQVSQPKAPERQGYTFEGWYTDKECTALYDFRAEITDRLTLYAGWTAAAYTVEYNANGEDAQNIPEMQSKAHDTVISLSADVPSRIGYTFNGWNTKADGSGTSYSAGGELSLNANVTLYAQWSVNKYTAALVTGDGVSGSISRNEVEHNGTVKITIKGTDSHKAPHISVVPAENAEQTAEGEYKITGPVSFIVTAEEKKVYTANFYLDDGLYYTQSAIEDSGDTLVLPAPPEKKGHTFTGWYTSDGSKADSSLPLDNNIDVYAKFESNTFNISAVKSGAGYELKSADPDTAEYGGSYSFTVEIAEYYNADNMRVYANGILLSGKADNNIYSYKIDNISEDKLITVSGVELNKYTAVYIVDGQLYAQADAEHGSKLAEPAAPAKPGAEFMGWTADGAAWDFENNVLSSDIILTAQWSGNTYTVVPASSGKGYTVSSADGTSVGYGGSYSFTVETAEHYNAEDMQVYANGVLLIPSTDGSKYSFTVENITSNVTITVNGIKADTYRVTYMLGGEEYHSEDIAYGEKAQKPETPQKAGYTFDGWYKDRECSVRYDFDSVISGGTTLYSKWTAGEYTIEYNSNCADNVEVPDRQCKDHDRLISLSPEIPSRTGYTFIGWNTKTDGSGISYSAGGELNLNADTTLYAQWQLNKYAVSLVMGAGVSGDISAAEVEHNGTVSLSVKGTDKHNKPYISAVPAENAQLIEEGVYKITGPVSFIVTAEEKRVYTAKFYLDDGLYYTQSAIEGSGDKIILPNPPQKQGYSFMGWFTSQTNGEPIDKDTVLDKDMTVYARFETNTFTINPASSGKGYTVSSAAGTSVGYGGSYSFTVETAEHYNAEDMKVYANGVLLIPSTDGSKYSFTVENITNNVTITVSGIKADTYHVTYMLDGEVYYSENVVYGEKARKPKAPVKNGYSFDAWFNGDSQWDFESGVEADLELSAVFTILSYPVTLPPEQPGFTISTESENPVKHGGSFRFDITANEGYRVSDIQIYANGVLLDKAAVAENTISFELSDISEAIVISVRGIGQNTYAVTYNSNTTDYVGNMPENALKLHDEELKISELVPERYGYDFLGYSAEKDGEIKYNAGDTYSENNDLILYAVWSAKRFNVSFETNGGTIDEGMITEYSYGTGEVLPTAVQRDRYTFAGWYEDELMQGERVYEIKADDYGDKKYYAAYTLSDVALSGYEGEYDGGSHDIMYTLADDIKVDSYQWYFVKEGTSEAVAVDSDSYNTYSVSDVSESGEYYCRIDAIIDDMHVIRFFTQRASVKITRKPVSIKAADAGKTYDALPLRSDKTELVNDTALTEGHIIVAVMTEESSLTDVGTKANEIADITISDSENKDVTDNYEITKLSGTLAVTPLTLDVAAENISVYSEASLSENQLYKISGIIGGAKLSLANTVVSAKNEKGEAVAFADITKRIGKYTVTIAYNGFNGDGGMNYRSEGEITPVVTVTRRSSGGGGGGGGGTSSCTVRFDTNGAGEIKPQSVSKNKTAVQPENPKKESYSFDGWFTDKELTKPYDFTAPVKKSFTLYAKWTEEKPDDTEVGGGAAENHECRGTAEDNCPSLEFNDLDVKAWYHLNVDFVLNRGIMNGISEESFAPNGKLTRAMLVTVLYRIENEPEVSDEAVFDDIESDAYYKAAVNWAKKNGIVKGYSDTEFCPHESIIREQIAAIMYRYAQYKGYNTDIASAALSYEDADKVSEYALSALKYAVGSGLIKGRTDTTLNPGDTATRAETAAILQRFIDANS